KPSFDASNDTKRPKEEHSQMAAEFLEAFLLLDDASLLDAPSPSAAIAERAAQASEPAAPTSFSLFGTDSDSSVPSNQSTPMKQGVRVAQDVVDNEKPSTS
uniref:ICA69 domain-containing protein n=1 Tax=Steinernema glaseri TaxID=37863 RepID=A0A1I8AS60_9BILA